MPPFDASYATLPRCARVAPPLDMLMMHPPLLVTLEEVARLVHQPGTVDERVDIAEALEGGGEQAVHVRLLRNVGHDSDCLAARGGDRLGGIISRGCHVVDHDTGAFLAEPRRYCPADSMPCPGHQHHAARK